MFDFEGAGSETEGDAVRGVSGVHEVGVSLGYACTGWLRFRCFAEIWRSNVLPASCAQISGSLRQAGESAGAWRMTKGVLPCNTPIITPA